MSRQMTKLMPWVGGKGQLMWAIQMLLFNISNLPLLLMTTGISFLMFAVLYILAYRMTSNTYYQLVNGRHREDSRFQID